MSKDTTFIWFQVYGTCGGKPIEETILVDLPRPIQMYDRSEGSSWVCLEDRVKRFVALERHIPFMNGMRLKPIAWSDDIDFVNPGSVFCLVKSVPNMYLNLEEVC